MFYVELRLKSETLFVTNVTMRCLTSLWKNITRFRNVSISTKIQSVLTWIGLKIGTSTRGLSRWLRGRGRQVPHRGEFSPASAWSRRRGREIPWAAWRATRPARATLHGRKWLIHVGWGRTACKERFTCEKPHLPNVRFRLSLWMLARANFHLYRKTIVCCYTSPGVEPITIHSCTPSIRNFETG